MIFYSPMKNVSIIWLGKQNNIMVENRQIKVCSQCQLFGVNQK